MRWNVEVFGGVPPGESIAARAPIEFSNAPSVYVGSTGEPSEPRFSTFYKGVLLETRSPGSVSMVADGISESLHVMENVWHVFFEAGGLEIEGVETRPDGVTVRSRWECSLGEPTEQDREVLRQVFGGDAT